MFKIGRGRRKERKCTKGEKNNLKVKEDSEEKETQNGRYKNVGAERERIKEEGKKKKMLEEKYGNEEKVLENMEAKNIESDDEGKRSRRTEAVRKDEHSFTRLILLLILA
jgi:hypothetical protein